MRERGRETEAGERMNGASKIGREQRGEKEDECMHERESTCRRAGERGIAGMRKKNITL